MQQLFEAAGGAVLDVKLFPCLDQFRGASALVRMASVEAAERAIATLNNTTPANGVQSLIVRWGGREGRGGGVVEAGAEEGRRAGMVEGGSAAWLALRGGARWAWWRGRAARV